MNGKLSKFSIPKLVVFKKRFESQDIDSPTTMDLERKLSMYSEINRHIKFSKIDDGIYSFQENNFYRIVLGGFVILDGKYIVLICRMRWAFLATFSLAVLSLKYNFITSILMFFSAIIFIYYDQFTRYSKLGEFLVRKVV